MDGLGLPQTGQGAETLIATYRDLNAADIAHALQELPIKRRHEVAEAMDDQRLADVLGELPEAEQITILGTLEESRAADVLEEMDPDDAADLLAELSNVDRNRLLELMEPDEAEPVRQLLKYSEDTAGGIMTSEPVILAPDATIAEALARVREPELTPALASQVYVCRPPSATPTGRYMGLAHIQRLLREPPSTLVSGVLDDLEPLRPEAPLAEVTRYFATYNLVAAPVVDDEGPARGGGERGRRPRPPAPRGLARAGPPWLKVRGSTSPGGGGAASRTSSGSTPTPWGGSPRASPVSWAPAASSPCRRSS